jgi:hypothetical protein
MRNGRPVILFNGSELSDDDVLNHILFIEGDKAVQKQKLTDTQQALDRYKAYVEDMREDAARYQYFRSNQYWYRFDDKSVVGVIFPYDSNFTAKPMLDHYIDQLRQKAEGGE